jgi:hypothetical protein
MHKKEEKNKGIDLIKKVYIQIMSYHKHHIKIWGMMARRTVRTKQKGLLDLQNSNSKLEETSQRPNVSLRKTQPVFQGTLYHIRFESQNSCTTRVNKIFEIKDASNELIRNSLVLSAYCKYHQKQLLNNKPNCGRQARTNE